MGFVGFCTHAILLVGMSMTICPLKKTVGEWSMSFCIAKKTVGSGHAHLLVEKNSWGGMLLWHAEKQLE